MSGKHEEKLKVRILPGPAVATGRDQRAQPGDVAEFPESVARELVAVGRASYTDKADVSTTLSTKRGRKKESEETPPDS